MTESAARVEFTGDQLIAFLSGLAAGCLALEFATGPETWPVFLAWMRANAGADDEVQNPDVANPVAFDQARRILDHVFGRLGGHDD